MATVDVEGLRATVRALERLGVEVADLKQVMRSIGDIVTPSVREGINSRTGNLAGTVRSGAAKGKATIRAGGARARYAGVNNYSPHISGGPRLWLNKGAEKNQARIAATLDAGLRSLARKQNLI